ncbi:MAG TPA: hypothetical protein VEO91_04370 [Candidatus Limnocylindria bacterium]|nr:hypothetical protein [Candidatus Limnocylindria bacterium]
MTQPEPRRSAAWSVYLRGQYRLIRILDPLLRTIWRGFGLGNIVELRVPGRRTGRERRVLLGLLRDRDDWFLGHPNGEAEWTRNLEAAGGGSLSLSWPGSVPIVARRLDAGPERDRAIAATSQHVFPGNVVYRLARRHIRAVGVYFALEIAEPDNPIQPSTTPRL